MVAVKLLVLPDASGTARLMTLIKPNGAAHGSERRAASGINAVVARIETDRKIYRRYKSISCRCGPVLMRAACTVLPMLHGNVALLMPVHCPRLPLRLIRKP